MNWLRGRAWRRYRESEPENYQDMESNIIEPEQKDLLLDVLSWRFAGNMGRHPGLQWDEVLRRLEEHPEKLWSLRAMEETGGEPDVIGRDKNTGEFIFCDCAPESPKGRRSLCYDPEALQSRKEHKPRIGRAHV